MRRMRETGAPHVWLDGRHARRATSGRSGSRRSWSRCRAHGIDPVDRPDPGRAGRSTTPAAACAPTCDGRTHDPRPVRLRRGAPAPACTAPTGSRPTRCSRAWCSPSGSARPWPRALPRRARPGAGAPARRPARRTAPASTSPQAMTDGAGVLRSRESLGRDPRPRCASSGAARRARRPRTGGLGDHEPAHGRDVRRAGRRVRARRRAGRHWREDFPDRDDERWRGRLVGTLGAGADAVDHGSSVRRRWTGCGARPADRDGGRAVSLAADLAQPSASRPGWTPTRSRRSSRRAVDEDLDGGVDVTSVATVPGRAARRPRDLVARAPRRRRGRCRWPRPCSTSCPATASPCRARRVADGDRGRRAATCCSRSTGRTRDLLTGERTALNLLCHLSGVATVDPRAGSTRVAGTGAAVRDTRKTTPGLRALEKYAVRCGGGVNHRMSLSDAALVKDNHVVAAGGVAPAFDGRARRCSRGCRSRSRSTRSTSSTRGARGRRRPRPARQHAARPDARGGRGDRRPGPARGSGGLTLADAARGRRHRRRLPCRRRAHPLGPGARHRRWT